MLFKSQLNEIKDQTFYHFEMISIAIKRIAFLYLLTWILCIVRIKKMLATLCLGFS